MTESTVPYVEALLEREIGRRGLLGASVSGALLLGFGSVLPAGCRSYPSPPIPLQFFTNAEYAVFRAIAQAMLGLEDDPIDVSARVDQLVAGMDGTVKRDIRWILRIFEHGTHLFDLQGKRFTRLSRSDQERYLKGWMVSSLGARRIVFRALKLIAGMGYYGAPETWSLIGYDGPWIGRREEERRATFEAPVTATALLRK